MGNVIMNAVVSLDGFIAYPNDDPGPLFAFYENGPVAIAPGDPEREFHVSRPTAELMRRTWPTIGACVIGRHLFDITNGWEGRPASGDRVFVVTHAPPTDWPFPGAPFTFVTDGVASAIEQAKAFSGDRNVAVTAGNVGGQAMELGLVDDLVLDLVGVVLGSGVKYFGDYSGGTVLFEDPEIVQGDRVTHLRYRRTQ